MKVSGFSRFAAGCSLLVMLVAGMVPRAGYSQFQFIPPPGPPVRIISPANDAVFYAPVDIPLFAFTHGVASGVDSSEVLFTNVEFYTNGVELGPAIQLDKTTNRPLSYFDYTKPTPFASRFDSVWCLVWSNAPASPTPYALTAVAKGRYLLNSITRTSAPVNITILVSTVSNNAPDVVSIVATDPVAIAGTNVSWVWPGIPGTNTLPSWTNWPPPGWGYFTNWGPKPALFTVRRFGDASSSLTVNYQTAGTASNGVDYVPLPGFVNIPAGAGYGLIPIMPIDNGSNNLVKTVILTLTPATNLPAYLIGNPKQAEALILYRWPRPIPILLAGLPPGGSFLSDGTFHFNAAGPDGAWFSVQNSPDLVNWTSLCTNQVVQGSLDVIDPNAPGNPTGFYQVVPLTGTPPQ